MKKALGLIETIGLAAAIEAADAAVKAANVSLLGYENTKGSGKITVKIAGNVGAVKAGVAAATAAASRVGQVYGQIVIARPHDEINWLIDHIDRGPSKVEAQETDQGLVEEKHAIEGDLHLDEGSPSDEEPAVEETMLEEAGSGEAMSVKQCAAMTKSGSRCKLPAQEGSDYCHLHGKQAE